MRIPVIVIMALPLLLTAWSRAEGPPPALRIGVCLSLTGGKSGPGGGYLRAVQLWSRQRNETGGVLGRMVEIVVMDDRSDDAFFPRCYKDLAEGEIAFLLGPQDYDSAPDVVERAAKSRVPCVFPLPVPNAVWKDGAGYSFGLLSPPSDWPSGFFEVYAKAGGAQVALIAVAHPNSQAVLENAGKWARRYGLSPVFARACPAEDLPAALAEAKQSGARAIGIWPGSDCVPQAAKAVKEARLFPRAVYFSTSMGPDTMPDPPGREAEGFFTAIPWDARAAKAYPGGESFVEQYRQAYGQAPDWLAASAYAACQVFAAACESAASLDRDKVRSALSRLDTLTIVGRYGVDPSGMQLRQTPLVAQWQHGRREIVWPEEMRTARPQFRGEAR